MKRRITFLIGFISVVLPILSQDLEEVILEEMVVTHSEFSDLEPDEEEILSYSTLNKKLNINRLNPDDLHRIPFLTPFQCRNLSDYLNLYGEVFSMYELQAVEGFDSAVIHRLVPYLEIGPPRERIRTTPLNLLKQGRHELVIRFRQVLQKQDGYPSEDSVCLIDPDDLYLGTPQRYYFRYRYTFFDKVLIGFSGDKDAGEEFFRGSQPRGMDFYSGFLAIQNFRWMRQLIAGNFRASFGQGLTLGGSSFGSSVSFGSAIHYHAGFRPSQSVCEYGYLRGAAVTISTGPFDWSGFFSMTNKDAALSPVDTGSSSLSRFTSFTETGYHRTRLECTRKNQVKELSYGGHISYRGPFFLIGLTGFYGTWSGILQPEEQLYRHFALVGERFGACGADGRVRIGFAQLFGEFSISLNGGKAWLAGLTAVPVQGIDLLFLVRNYQPQFQNPYSTAMSQQGTTANEQGVFLRLQSQIIPKTTLSGYVDLFRFPWLRYRVNGPSNGMETGLMGLFQGSSYWSLSLRYSWRKGELNEAGNQEKTVPLAVATKQYVNVEVNILALPSVNLKSCLMIRHYSIQGQPREFGYLASQEIAYRGVGILRAIRLKYSLFDAPFYNARMYTSEPDLLYSWSSPAFYGKGVRCVLMFQSGIGRTVDLWGWLGLISYLDRESIGSGSERIDGNLKTEVKVQIRIRL